MLTSEISDLNDAIHFNDWVNEKSLKIPKGYYSFYALVAHIIGDIEIGSKVVIDRAHLAKRLGCSDRTIYRFIKVSNDNNLIRIENSVFQLMPKPWMNRNCNQSFNKLVNINLEKRGNIIFIRA